MSYTHLTEEERYVISHLSGGEFSLREIARGPKWSKMGRSCFIDLGKKEAMVGPSRWR